MPLMVHLNFKKKWITEHDMTAAVFLTVHELWICSRCKIRQYSCTDHWRADWKAQKQCCCAPVVDFLGPDANQCLNRYHHNMTHYSLWMCWSKFSEKIEEFVESDWYSPKEEELIWCQDECKSTNMLCWY
jgi:hypothetical protein